MSASHKDLETEELIKKTAKKLFFGEGKFNATTQEIAAAAGVNRTLINYYFRSRENLFNQVFELAIQKEDELRQFTLESDLPFREKIEQYLEKSISRSIEYPYLETYIVSCINDGCLYRNEEQWDELLAVFYQEFEQEVKKGNVEKMEPVQFVINLASLTAFPLAVKPLLQKSLKISDLEFERIIKDRKELIMKILFKN